MPEVLQGGCLAAGAYSQEGLREVKLAAVLYFLHQRAISSQAEVFRDHMPVLVARSGASAWPQVRTHESHGLLGQQQLSLCLWRLPISGGVHHALVQVHQLLTHIPCNFLHLACC